MGETLEATRRKEIGDRVRQVRRRLGLSQAEFAAYAGISEASVSNAESGRESVGRAMYGRLARALRVDEQWLLEGQAKVEADLAADFQREVAADPGRYLTGDEVSGLRRDLGLSQEQLARELGLSPATLYNVERGAQRLGDKSARRLLDLASRLAGGRAAGELNEGLLADIVEGAVRTAYRVLHDPETWQGLRAAAARLGQDEAALLTQICLSQVRETVLKRA